MYIMSGVCECVFVCTNTHTHTRARASQIRGTAMAQSGRVRGGGGREGRGAFRAGVVLNGRR